MQAMPNQIFKTGHLSNGDFLTTQMKLSDPILRPNIRPPPFTIIKQVFSEIFYANIKNVLGNPCSANQGIALEKEKPDNCNTHLIRFIAILRLDFSCSFPDS